jgi:2-dehydro-3-deoxyphosphogluconate aldolase / (4S)-4-hydroxy-2-oxoglutarate aldolase
MTRLEVGAQIRAIAIVPAIRVSTVDDGIFVADELARSGIPIVEVACVQPGALTVIAELAKRAEGVVGAGEVMDLASAQRCVDAGANFITGPGLDLEVMEFANRANVAVIPGALTPTEVVRAWRGGSDFVKIFPCANVGGARYMQALKAPFPDISMIASGGVHQATAADFIRSGASALGIGRALVPEEAIQLRQTSRIRELARRFLGIVNTTREEIARAQAQAREQPTRRADDTTSAPAP